MAMAGNDLRLGVRLEADPSNLRAGTEQGVREVRRLTEQTQRSGQQARGAARETRGFSDSMRNAASASAVLHGPLGGVASRFSSIATLATRAGLAMGAAGLAASAGVMGWLSFTRAAGNAEQQLFRLEARLQATGNAAGVSVQQINAFAQQLAEDTLTSTGAVREAAAELLGFTSVAGQDFFRVLSLAQDLGGNLTSNVQQIAQVLEAPEAGLGRLARRMSDLSFEQRQMIQEMIESGRQADAVRVILEHLERQIGGTGAGEAAGLLGATDTLGERWTRLKENLGNTGPITSATNALSGLLAELNQYLEARRGLEQGDGLQLVSGGPRHLGRRGVLGTGVGAFQQVAPQPPTPIVDLSGVEALQLQQQAAEAEAERRRQRLLEIEADASRQRVEIERSTNDQILAERDRLLRELEGLAAQGGLNPDEVAEAEAAVRARAAAAIEAAERPAREAAQRRAESEAERAANQAAANQQVLSGLQREYELLQTLAGTERDRAQAMDAAAGRLNEFASPAQIAAARELAGLIHEALEAEERRVELRAAEEDLSRRIAQQQLLNEFNGQETEEYRLQAELLELKLRLGDAGARQLEEQVRLAHELTTANQQQAEAWRQLQNILDQADPARALERQLELIEELKRQFPEYIEALDEAAAMTEQRMAELERNEFAVSAARGMQRAFADFFFRPFDRSLNELLASFIDVINRMIAEWLAMQALTALFGANFGTTGQMGGVVGNLFQFHGGGVAGAGGAPRAIAADEMLTVLRRGEEVLTTNDPRHRFNQGGESGGVTAIYNMIDGDNLAQAVMASPRTSKGIVNLIRANKAQIRTILGG